LIIVEWNVLGIVLFNREIIEFPLGWNDPQAARHSENNSSNVRFCLPYPAIPAWHNHLNLLIIPAPFVALELKPSHCIIWRSQK
jgi:hypothetical protein